MPLKGKYLLAVIEAVSPGKDSLVRSYKVGYGIPNETRDITKYKGRRWVTITHSAQRLSLLLSFKEQEEPLTEEGGNTISKSSAESEPGSEAVVEINSVIESSTKDGDKSTLKSTAEDESVPESVVDGNSVVQSSPNNEDNSTFKYIQLQGRYKPLGANSLAKVNYGDVFYLKGFGLS